MAAVVASMGPGIGGGHQTGPGERKSPARGKRLEVEPTPHTTRKRKSKSLERLLRK